MNIVRVRRTEGEDDQVALSLYLLYFLHRRRTHGIDFFLTKLPQVIIEYDTPTVVERPVGSHGIEHAVGAAPEMQQYPDLRKVLRSY